MHATVLVFPCGSEIGLEICRSLRHSSHVTLIGASSVESNHGKYLYRRYIEGLPFVDSPEFVPVLNATIAEHGVTHLFAAHDSVVLKFAQETSALSAMPVGSAAGTAEVCRSKRSTYERFAGILRVPAMYDPADDGLPFPLFLKPDVGQGSRGAHIVRTREELAFRVARDPSSLVLEYLPGDEYTVDCFTDRHGALRFTGGRERVRTSSGISVDTRAVDDFEFAEIAAIINGRLALRGMWFFQVKRAADGALALLEIAPRVAGAMGLQRNLGANLPLAALYDAMGQDVDFRRNAYDLRMDRALEAHFVLPHVYRHVYMDLDDCLVQRGEVDLAAIAFLYQCRNRGVSVHLLSRHAADLQETLARYCLGTLLTSVIHVTDSSPKSRWITERDAIFIDDSFRERKDVIDTLAIPAFGPEAIESLIDWRR